MAKDTSFLKILACWWTSKSKKIVHSLVGLRILWWFHPLIFFNLTFNAKPNIQSFKTKLSFLFSSRYFIAFNELFHFPCPFPMQFCKQKDKHMSACVWTETIAMSESIIIHNSTNQHVLCGTIFIKQSISWRIRLFWYCRV